MARIELSNIGGGGTTLSLTTTGTSGAATLAGSVLNIPIYQGQLTLTTTGTSGAATLSGTTLNIPQYSGGGGTPAGSAGEIQFNSTPAGSFAASANLAWDNAGVRLNIGAPSSPTGKLNIKSGGATSATVNLRLTNSSNTELLRVNDAGSVGIGGLSTSAALEVNRVAGNNPALFLVNSSTNVPAYTAPLFNPPVTTNTVCFWSPFGTSEGGFQLAGFSTAASTYAPANIIGYVGNSSGNSTWGAVGINGYKFNGTGSRAALSGNDIILSVETDFNSFFGFRANGNLNVGSNFIPSARLHVRGSNTSSGTNALLVQNSTPSDIYKIENNGKISYLANAISGTTGNQTIDRPSGNVNFAIGASALTVTNSLCTTSSLVFATVRTNDATAYIKNVVPAAGSFTINLGANATAVTSVGFFIIN